MGRKKVRKDRGVVTDPNYGSVLLAKLTRSMMTGGRLSVSWSCVYRAMEHLKQKVDGDEFKNFNQAIDNVKPDVEVRSKRVGGSTYQVPVSVREERREALSLRWIIKAARSRSGQGMGEKLGAELVDAFNKTGAAYRKKEDTHRMAEANKAFSHYR